MKDEDSGTTNMDVEFVDFANYENKDDLVDEKHKESTKQNSKRVGCDDNFSQIQDSSLTDRNFNFAEKGAKMECYIAGKSINAIKDILKFNNCRREGDNFAVP